jgi:hypothetical protein
MATWTQGCLAKEAAGESDAARCWREAAAAADEYASGFDGPLMDELHRLQSIWLQRADRLEPATAPVAPAVPSASPGKAKVKPLSVAKAARTPSPLARTAKKVAAAKSAKQPSAKQPIKSTASAKYPSKDREVKDREVKVVPASHEIAGREDVSAPDRLAKARKKAELKAIRRELDAIAGRIECLSRRCPQGKD